MQRLRAMALVMSVVLLSAAAAGQDLVPRELSSSDDLVKWLSQGGLTAVLLVVLWSYRRDFQQRLGEQHKEAEGERRRADAFLSALEKTTAALATHTEASRAQADAFSKVAHSIQLCEAVRHMVTERES